MNVYEAGNAALGAGRGAAATMGGAGVDVAMPGSIRDEILSIAGSFRRLDAAIRAAAVLPADFKSAWGSFRDEWSEFAARHGSWASNLWYKSYQKALEYRQALNDWRKRFEQLTGSSVTFPAPQDAPGPTMSSPFSGRWKTIAYVAGGIGVLWGVSKLLGGAVEAKREFFGARALPAPAALVRNPPAWAQDPELWESARVAVEPYADRYDNAAAVTTHVYKQMGGRVGA
jgi:hypothetical protein